MRGTTACYAYIINHTNVQFLPFDEIPEGLLWVLENDDSDSQEDENDDLQQESCSYCPLPVSQSTAISLVINRIEPLDWPDSREYIEWVQRTFFSYKMLSNTFCMARDTQARESTHAHGCTKLKNNPGTCNLMQKAAQARVR